MAVLLWLSMPKRLGSLEGVMVGKDLQLGSVVPAAQQVFSNSDCHEKANKKHKGYGY